ARPAPSARCTSPHRSASATPSATSQSPTNSGRCIPTWSSTGSRRAPPPRATESRQIESESAEHDLHCFQAIRRMDEILLADFMVFHDLTREEDYDLRIGGGARA